MKKRYIAFLTLYPVPRHQARAGYKCMKYLIFWRKRKLQDQIDAYLAWKENIAPGVTISQKEFLYKFMDHTEAWDVMDIAYSEIVGYLTYVRNRHSDYLTDQAVRSIRGLLRYYKARGYPCIRPTEVCV